MLEDDNEINQLLCDILSENQYHCVSEYSGKHAYETLRNKSFDMILLDLMLPELPGEELLVNLRRFSKVPVIIISAKDEMSVKVDMLRAGADDYIIKPFDNK